MSRMGDKEAQSVQQGDGMGIGGRHMLDRKQAILLFLFVFKYLLFVFVR